MVLDEDIHNLHCKNIEIHRQQSGKYVRCRFVPKKKSRKTLVCRMKKMSSKKHQQSINSKHCYFYTLLITQFLSHFNPLCTSKKNLSPFVLWIFKKTYSLFLLNNTLIPSWRVAFNPRRKLVIKSMKPIFRAKSSMADWERTWIVRWLLGFLSNIGIPNVNWNNKNITPNFILLCLIWSRELTGYWL